MRPSIKILLCFFFLAAHIVCAQKFTLVKDLATEWQVFEGERYVPFQKNEGKVKTVYFWLEPSNFEANILRVESNEPYTIFVNGQLFANSSMRLDLRIDSLRQLFPNPVLLVGIYQEKIRAGGLKTHTFPPDQNPHN